MVQVPRGIRNNNPLNIRKGSSWKGLSKQQTDRSFCQFDSMLYGLRAACVLIRNYIEGRVAGGKCFNTIDAIIRRWAPASENNCERYVSFVSSKTGILPFEVVKFSERSRVVGIIYAMAWYECGQQIDKSLVFSAYDLVR